MKVVDILNQKHTVLMSMSGWHNEHQGFKDYTQTNMTLNDILFGLGNKFKSKIDELRQESYHSDRYNEIKKYELPVWFVGGTFPFQHTDDVDILTYSNLLCIDIDNQDIDRKAIFDLPYVVAVLRSSGGVGYYVLILVEDGRYTLEYYSYLAKLFKTKFKIDVDPKCKNIGRKRVLSYDDDIYDWIKDNDTDIQPWKIKGINQQCNNQQDNTQRLIDYKPVSMFKNDNIEFTRKAIWYLLNNGYSVDDINTKDNRYSVWYYVGCEFRHFSDGYDMFVRFSNNSSNYHDDIKTINKKWDSTKQISSIDDVCRKWCGICKNKFGYGWWKNIS